MKPNLIRVDVDLAVVRTAPGVEFVPHGAMVEAIIPLIVPAGSGLVMQIGDNNPLIPMEVCPNLEDVCCDEGIKFSNPAGVGTAVVLFSISGGPTAT
jgi:hypothetical protein